MMTFTDEPLSSTINDDGMGAYKSLLAKNSYVGRSARLVYRNTSLRDHDVIFSTRRHIVYTLHITRTVII